MSVQLKIQPASFTGQPLWWQEGKIFKVLFTAILTGTYPTNGDIADLLTLFNTTSSAPGLTLPTAEAVAKVELQSARTIGATGSAGLYLYQYAPGTTLSNGGIQVFTGAAAQSALAELSAGAYPANVLNDVISGEAYFVMP